MPIEKIIKKKKYVVDASVAVKWFCEEAGFKEAEAILAEVFAGSVEMYAPDLLVYEIANALFKGKQFESERVQAALETIYNSPIQLLTPDKLLSVSATRFMTNYNITFYDAVYAGLAHVLQVPLLTANPKDHKKIKEIEQVQL